MSVWPGFTLQTPRSVSCPAAQPRPPALPTPTKGPCHPSSHAEGPGITARTSLPPTGRRRPCCVLLYPTPFPSALQALVCSEEEQPFRMQTPLSHSLQGTSGPQNEAKVPRHPAIPSLSYLRSEAWLCSAPRPAPPQPGAGTLLCPHRLSQGASRTPGKRLCGPFPGPCLPCPALPGVQHTHWVVSPLGRKPPEQIPPPGLPVPGPREFTTDGQSNLSGAVPRLSVTQGGAADGRPCPGGGLWCERGTEVHGSQGAPWAGVRGGGGAPSREGGLPTLQTSFAPRGPSVRPPAALPLDLWVPASPSARRVTRHSPGCGRQADPLERTPATIPGAPGAALPPPPPPEAGWRREKAPSVGPELWTGLCARRGPPGSPHSVTLMATISRRKAH